MFEFEVRTGGFRAARSLSRLLTGADGLPAEGATATSRFEQGLLQGYLRPELLA